MATYKKGEGYTAYYGRAASAPGSPTNPEGDANMHQIGEIEGDIAFTSTLSETQYHLRTSPRQTFRVAGDIVEQLAYDMYLDTELNAAYTDLKGAHESTTAGVGASGDMGYFALSNNVAGEWLAHGHGLVLQWNVTLPRTGLIHVPVIIGPNGKATVTTHA